MNSLDDASTTVGGVTGQLADKPTRGQSSHGLVTSWTSQLAEMFDLKVGVYNSSKCYFRQITLYAVRVSVFDRVRVRVRFNVQIKYSNSMFLKIRCRRFD